MVKTILWLIFAYLFASIPNGYLIVKWYSGKDIRTVGRKKLSASNIMHNIGILPGVLSAIFDVFKGTVAVAGAYFLGLGPIYQGIAGALAVAGQMWPIFFNFWGGRGGATSIGALLFLNPLITLIAVVFWIMFKLVSKEMGAALGMMTVYLLITGFGFYWSIQQVYVFSILAFILIMVQRLLGSPGTFLKIKNKKIILWRLLLDRDTKERQISEKKSW
jgi:glycerol-3-phosphate acyltransferase PlsY